VQITVENWLVLQLSHSGLALGVTNALQFGPSVAFGMYGGVIADRYDRRRVLIVTQTGMGLLALAVGVLASLGLVRVWMIWLAAGAFGLIKCFDLPAQQSFVKDLVGTADLPNAVALTNLIGAVGRTVGPVVGGWLLASLGIATGFVLNAATFAVVVAILLRLDAAKLAPRAQVPRESDQIRQGLRYVVSEPDLAITSVVMFAVFSAYNFQIALALIASQTLAGGGQVYGVLMSALGLGVVAGSLAIARRARTGVKVILLWTAALAAAQLAVEGAHSVPVLLPAVFAYGVSAGLFSVTVINTLQSQTAEDMRGRVMAVYSVAFLGSSLVGAPTFGAITQWIGVSGAMDVAACICAVVVLGAAVVRRLLCDYS
jgi:MFS family permease